MTARGKAFEYALAKHLSQVLDVPIVQSDSTATANEFYDMYGVSDMDDAAAEAVMFLNAYDKHLREAVTIHIQGDARGQDGDPRDVIVRLKSGEIGISAKNHHRALKHPRLSRTIDFGSRWADYPVSREYWRAVRPIFDHMADLRDQKVRFKDLGDKETGIYLPVLTAFEDEFRRLYQAFGALFIQRVFRFMVGRYDFYKVVKERGHVNVASYNINGSLEWGPRWQIPTGLDFIRRKPNSRHTLIVGFTGGWQMSFRLHSARSIVEPSLKFDVNFEATPVTVTSNQIPVSN